MIRKSIEKFHKKIKKFNNQKKIKGKSLWKWNKKFDKQFFIKSQTAKKKQASKWLKVSACATLLLICSKINIYLEGLEWGSKKARHFSNHRNSGQFRAFLLKKVQGFLKANLHWKKSTPRSLSKKRTFLFMFSKRVYIIPKCLRNLHVKFFRFPFHHKNMIWILNMILCSHFKNIRCQRMDKKECKRKDETYFYCYCYYYYFPPFCAIFILVLNFEFNI